MKVWNACVGVVKEQWAALRAVTLNQWIQAIGGVWCLLVSWLLLTREGDYADIAFAQDASLLTLGLGLVTGVLVIAAVNRLLPRLHVERYVFLFGVLLLCVLLVTRAVNLTKFYLYYAVMAVVACVLFYAAYHDVLRFPLLRVGRVGSAVTVGVLFLLMAAAIALVGTLRYVTFNTPNFDFGIFSHMFHHMRDSLQPLTTCERDQMMSHFAVHISPIYYVLLPFYAIFPSPVTLAIGQGVVIASGVIPLYLLARKLGLSNKIALLATMAYAAYPALSCGTLYDLHENCFLAPLLLWVFYFCESRRTVPLIVSIVLVLMVKEDAAIYIALFGLYRIAEHREWRRGLLFMIGAVAYFFLAVYLINTFGDGVLSDRYYDLQYEDTGLVGMVKTLIINPGVFLERLFSPGGSDSKLRYLAQLAVPLGVALFTTRRLSRYVLLLPVLLNLFSSSPYQYNLSFQYGFGISAFFFYLCLLNLRDAKPVTRKAMVSHMAVGSLLLYLLLFVPNIEKNIERYQNGKPTYERMEAILATVPDDASVTCSTFLLPHLAQRDVVYEDFYHAECDTDYVVLDMRPGYLGEALKTEERFVAAGYVEVLREDELLILKRGE